VSADYYTWDEFKEAVRSFMYVDANRLGLQDTTSDTGAVVPGYISMMIRQGVIDLQRFIPAFRKQHETLYYPEDLVVEGLAGRGVLPPFAKVTDAYLFSFDNDSRYPITEFGWESRHELTNGMESLNDNNGRICIEPDAYKFYVYPVVTGNLVLSLNWDAQLDSGKSDFQGAELVPFPEDAAFAVAEFVKGHIRREVERDAAAFGSYFHPSAGTYTVARKNLYLTAKERMRTRR